MRGVCSLDRLYRFSRHDDAAHGVPGVLWIVSAGSLDDKGRIYRYSYSVVGNERMEREVTIALGKKSLKRSEKADIVTFYADLKRFARNVELAPHFRLACLDLLTEDPWLVAMSSHAQALAVPDITDAYDAR